MSIMIGKGFWTIKHDQSVEKMNSLKVCIKRQRKDIIRPPTECNLSRFNSNSFKWTAMTPTGFQKETKKTCSHSISFNEIFLEVRQVKNPHKVASQPY